MKMENVTYSYKAGTSTSSHLSSWHAPSSYTVVWTCTHQSLCTVRHYVYSTVQVVQFYSPNTCDSVSGLNGVWSLPLSTPTGDPLYLSNITVPLTALPLWALLVRHAGQLFVSSLRSADCARQFFLVGRKKEKTVLRIALYRCFSCVQV